MAAIGPPDRPPSPGAQETSGSPPTGCPWTSSGVVGLGSSWGWKPLSARARWPAVRARIRNLGHRPRREIERSRRGRRSRRRSARQPEPSGSRVREDGHARRADDLPAVNVETTIARRNLAPLRVVPSLAVGLPLRAGCFLTTRAPTPDSQFRTPRGGANRQCPSRHNQPRLDSIGGANPNGMPSSLSSTNSVSRDALLTYSMPFSGSRPT